MPTSVPPPPQDSPDVIESNDSFILQHTTVLDLPSGKVLIRPIAADDKEQLESGLAMLSPESRYRRFFAPINHFTDAELTYLTELDYTNHFAWGAIAVDEPGRPGIGVARYVRTKENPNSAEAAVVVADEWQSKGIGGVLLRVLAETAQHNGIDHFEALVLATNEPALEFMRRFGASLEADESVVKVSIPLPLPADEFSSTDLYRMLKAAAHGDIEAQPEPVKPERESPATP